MSMDSIIYNMSEAIREGQRAYEKGEIPVGCVIVKDDIIISRSHNMRERNKNALHHAEILAIDEVCKKLGRWRLTDCHIYVTLEPCMMCSGAIINSRIKRIYYGAYDEECGGIKFLERTHPEIETFGGISEDDCTDLLKKFFIERRKI